MKFTVYKENERAFYTCPDCGEKCTVSAYGMVAYEAKALECPTCKVTSMIYINQIGKVFTCENRCVKYIGYTYKVL